jgi:hypothetical protein
MGPATLSRVGKKRWDEAKVAQLERKVGQQTLGCVVKSFNPGPWFLLPGQAAARV